MENYSESSRFIFCLQKKSCILKCSIFMFILISSFYLLYTSCIIPWFSSFASMSIPTVTVLLCRLLYLPLDSFQYYHLCLPLIYLSPRNLPNFKFDQATPQLSGFTDHMQN